ncbi:unnamed protein product [Umbelopsis vinacea]
MSIPSSPYYIRNRVNSLPSFSSLLQGPYQEPSWLFTTQPQDYLNGRRSAYSVPRWDQDDQAMAAAASLLDLQSAAHSDSDSHSSSPPSSQSARASSPMSQIQTERGSSHEPQQREGNAIKKRLRPSRSTPLPIRTVKRSPHERDKKKPRWNNSERCNLFMAIIRDKDLDNMASYNWEKIASRVGRARKACKDQWRREVLPALIHNLKTELFQ